MSNEERDGPGYEQVRKKTVNVTEKEKTKSGMHW